MAEPAEVALAAEPAPVVDAPPAPYGPAPPRSVDADRQLNPWQALAAGLPRGILRAVVGASFTRVRVDLRRTPRDAGQSLGPSAQHEHTGRTEQLFAGARIKVLRTWRWQLPPGGGAADLGVGGSLELGGADGLDRFQPRARFKYRFTGARWLLGGRQPTATLALLPTPTVSLKAAIGLPGPSGLALGFRAALSKDSSVCHLALFHPPAKGLYLAPSGLRIDESILRIGDTGSVRLAAGLVFPPNAGLDLRLGQRALADWFGGLRLRVDNISLQANLP